MPGYRKHRPSPKRPNDPTKREKTKFFNVDNTSVFHVKLDEEGKVPEILVTGVLGWNAFSIINAIIFNAINKSGYTLFNINLSQIERGFAEGIIPLISSIKMYKLKDVNFTVTLPRNHEIRAIFNNHNWSYYLDSRYPKSKKQLPRTTGLVEFDSPETLNELMRQAMELVIRAVKFAKGARESLEWSLNEITDNVLRHSKKQSGWFELTWDAKGNIFFTVCDCGVGIPTTMREAFPEIESDHDSLARAVERGVTSSNEGQGNGLAGTLAIVKSGNGKLRINSQKGHLRYDSNGLKYEPLKIPYPGTYVFFSLCDDSEIDIKEALLGHEVYTYAKSEYDYDDSDAIYIVLTKEAQSFGNRATGLKIRNLINNLMSEFPGKKIIIDFLGVEIVSSSFADEIFGKFILEWGIIGFNKLIKLKDANAFIEGLINKVVMQRMGQAYAQGLLGHITLDEGA